MKKLNSIELENWRKYHKVGCSALTGRCKVNQVKLEAGKRHNLKVLSICKDLIEKDHKFLCEAVPNDEQSRRIDIVDISTGEEIEVEDTGKIKERFNICYYWDGVKWGVIMK